MIRAIFCSCLFSICLIFSAKASHIVGGELNYLRINDSTYQITLKAYRDCYLGIPLFDNPALINVFDGNNTFLGRFQVQRPAWDTLSVELSNPCLVVPPDVCVEKVEYVFIANLPVNTSGYQLAYQRCCRNSTILNIFDDVENLAESSGASYYAYIPPVSQGRNSNPYFNNQPPLAICANNRLVFDHSATDPDGDSLVYRLCTPNDGLSTSAPTAQFLLQYPPFQLVRYRNPYSLEDMLGGPEKLSINSKTGELTALPNRVGQFVVGVCVEEFRNGTLISETKRDFQFNVADCERVVVSSFFNVDTLCNEKRIVLNNRSQGAVSYFWSFGDGTTSTSRNPSHTYENFGIYEIMLVANPGSQCADTSRRTVYINEDNLSIQNPQGPVCAGELLDFKLTAQNGRIESVSWNVNGTVYNLPGNSISLSLTQNTQFNYTAKSSQGCTYNGSFQIEALPVPQVNAFASPSVIVLGQTTQLEALSATGEVFRWSPTATLSSPNLPTSQASPKSDTWYTVSVKSPLNECEGRDTVLVEVRTCEDSIKPVLNVLQNGNCGDDAFIFEASSQLDGVNYLWNFGDGTSAQGDTVSHVYNKIGTYSVRLIYEKQGLCKDTLVTQVAIEVPNLSYDNPSFTACLNSEILIDLNIQSEKAFTVAWQHLDRQPTPVDSLLYLVPRDEFLFFDIILENGCSVSDSIFINAIGVQVNAVVDKSIIEPGVVIQLSALPASFVSYSWLPADILSDAEISNPSSRPLFTTLFEVSAEDADGCLSSDSVLVEVNIENICSEKYIYIPTAFTPNGDGKNDTWQPRTEYAEELEVMIFNRWGEKVFSSSNLNESWDGNYKSKPANAGSYAYVVKVRCIGGLFWEHKGNITLIR